MLEAEYKMITKDKKYSPSLKSLSANLDMSDKQIEIWFRRRKLYGIKVLVYRVVWARFEPHDLVTLS